MRFISWNLDFLGFSASFLCAIHCLSLPFLLSLGILGGASWLEAPAIEWGLIVVAIIVASWAIGKNYFETHRQVHPLLWAILGFILLLSSRFIEGEFEHLATAIGGFAIAFAHYENWKLSTCRVVTSQ